jgi:hypothetical protein
VGVADGRANLDLHAGDTVRLRCAGRVRERLTPLIERQELDDDRELVAGPPADRELRFGALGLEHADHRVDRVPRADGDVEAEAVSGAGHVRAGRRGRVVFDVQVMVRPFGEPRSRHM